MKKSLLGILMAMVLMFGGVLVCSAREDETGLGGTTTPTTSSTTGASQYDPECDEECQVIRESQTETETKNPPSGAFLPYAIVIGGIAFSVAAIALAKKNNKLYQV